MSAQAETAKNAGADYSKQYTWAQAVKDYWRLSAEQRKEVQYMMDNCKEKREIMQRWYFVEAVDVVRCRVNLKTREFF